MIGLANHLWQSTLVALAAACLTAMLRRNRAPVRHGIWLAASAKFLVPFALLVTLGQWVERTGPTPVRSVPTALTLAADRVSHPFSTDDVVVVAGSPGIERPGGGGAVRLVALVAWGLGCAAVFFPWLVRWRRIASLARRTGPVQAGREWTILRRLERVVAHKTPVALVITETSLEPGVLGIVRPRLLWPRALSARLSDRQIETILAHELCHVRRRDNLAALVQKLVESLFWFHPVVWWIGTRLVDERERACDEGVLDICAEPRAYAEGILAACRFSIESPIACVSGVTGSDLRARIERIVNGDACVSLTSGRALLLAAAGLAAMATPFLAGIRAPLLHAQAGPVLSGGGPSFEVASIKRNTSGEGGVRIQVQPGGRFVAVNTTLRQLVRNAYQLENFQLTGGPVWFNADHFDIVAKATVEIPDPFLEEQGGGPSLLQLLLRSLLADRFKLVLRTESREMPIYALGTARSDRRLGPQLKASTTNCSTKPAPGGNAGGTRLAADLMCGINMGPGKLSAVGVTLAQLASALSGWATRTVLDRTNLDGRFDVQLTWTPDPAQPGLKIATVDTNLGPGAAAAPDATGASLFTAVQEQLGLKLEATRGPIDVIVVDSAQQPAEN